MDFSESATVDERLENLCRGMTALSMLHYARMHYTFGHDVFGYTKGKKYARVWYDMSNGQRMVAFFVDMSDGTVWKADGWKKPTLNFPRGNVWTLDNQREFLDHRSDNRISYGGI